ncbi:MAG: FAD-dependent oxidoreductase [Proteobacteria bacterium]|nr:FAD-dependent oxidoreductase [Pseudomonadota bacterium]
MKAERFVVIGGDAAGMSAASLVKRRRPEIEVEAYEMGGYTSYGACGMPYYIGGEVPELDDLVVVRPEDFRNKRGIEVFMRHRVERIYPDRKLIEVRDLEGGTTREATYDRLLIATGARPIVPRGFDLDMEGVFALRGLDDADGIKRYIHDHGAKTALIVGTGYIGVEMAEALSMAGLEVTTVGRPPRVLPTFEEEIGQAVTEELTRHGVRVLIGAEAVGVERPSDGRLSLTLASGEALSADLIVVGAGVLPRSELAAEAGLALGFKKAIQVDRGQRTSDESIWAAGDCAEAYHRLLGRNTYVPLALHANRQGRIAGTNILGGKAEFPGILSTAVCKIFDLAAARTGLGLVEAEAEGLDVVKVVVTGNSRAHYYPGGGPVKTVLIVEKRGRKLWGAQMVGRDGVAHRINTWAAVLASGMSLEEIHGLDLAYAPPFSPVWDPVLVASEIAMKQVKEK